MYRTWSQASQPAGTCMSYVCANISDAAGPRVEQPRLTFDKPKSLRNLPSLNIFPEELFQHRQAAPCKRQPKCLVVNQHASNTRTVPFNRCSKRLLQHMHTHLHPVREFSCNEENLHDAEDKPKHPGNTHCSILTLVKTTQRRTFSMNPNPTGGLVSGRQKGVLRHQRSRVKTQRTYTATTCCM